MPNILELFSGASGFGLGAEMAGFDLLAAVDNDPSTTFSHRVNFPKCKLLIADLGDMSGEYLLDALNVRREEIHGIIGGPPCQGFSRGGLRNPKDPRNNLLKRFFTIVSYVDPAFFIMENVPGLLDKDNKDVVEAAFSVIPTHYVLLGPVKLNAKKFGVPTNRERVILFGYDPSRLDLSEIDTLISEESEHVTVKEAILDLPSPSMSTKDVQGYFWGRYTEAVQDLPRYAATLRGVSERNKALTYNHNSLLEKAAEVSGVNPTKHTDAVKNRFRELSPGSRDEISKALKLDWSGLCPTLRAGTAADRGSYQALRPIHPGEPRMITIREAARLQGFPDWFQFHPTIWHSFRMIGNSVSPIFAAKLLAMIHNKFPIETRAIK